MLFVYHSKILHEHFPQFLLMSSKAGYQEYILGFEPVRNGEIFWINYNSYWPLQKIPEHTIMLFVYHPNILHKHFLQFLLGGISTPQKNLRKCLCKILGWQTKSIMVCSGIFWSGQLLCWVWLLSSMSLKRPNNIKLEWWSSRSN